MMNETDTSEYASQVRQGQMKRRWLQDWPSESSCTRTCHSVSLDASEPIVSALGFDRDFDVVDVVLLRWAWFECRTRSRELCFLDQLARPSLCPIGSTTRGVSNRYPEQWPALVESFHQASGLPVETINGMLRKAQPIQRLGTPEESGKAVLFLLSDDCPFMTGALLGADGGYTCQ